jgi:hypothetical protein
VSLGAARRRYESFQFVP